MKLYEWMVEFTPQTGWSENKGIISLIAFYAGPLGSSLYLLSLYFDSLVGIWVSWLLVAVLKGSAHIIELKHPLRFWRMGLRPGSSWISRGVLIMILFIGLVAFQLLLSHYHIRSTINTIIIVLAAIMAVGLSFYPGFVLNYVRGIPLWNSSLLPVLFMLSGAVGGFGLIIAIGIYDGNVNTYKAIAGSGVFLVTTAFLFFVHMLSVTYTGPAGNEAVKQIIKGNLAPTMWIAFVLFGIIIPVGLISFCHFGQATLAPYLLTIIAICEIIHGLSVVYLILKGGIYNSLIPTAQEL